MLKILLKINLHQLTQQKTTSFSCLEEKSNPRVNHLNRLFIFQVID